MNKNYYAPTVKKSRLTNIQSLENYRYELTQRKINLARPWGAIFSYATKLPIYPSEYTSNAVTYFKGIYNGELYLFSFLSSVGGLHYNSYPINITLNEHSSLDEIMLIDSSLLPLYINVHFIDQRCRKLFKDRIKNPVSTTIQTNNELVKLYFHIISRQQRLSKSIKIITDILQEYIETSHKKVISANYRTTLNISFCINNRMYILQFLNQATHGNWILLPEITTINVTIPSDISNILPPESCDNYV